MTTVRQDNYVMETQVQPGEWAKQKEKSKEWDGWKGKVTKTAAHSAVNVSP